MALTALRLAVLLSGTTVGVAAIAGLAVTAEAQITPDNTLGGESSQVRTGAMVPRDRSSTIASGELADLIEGGATRGSNLFHSFLEFNVDGGQRVYFANPAGIEAILSRITGSNPSNIFGTLGVDGSADLFLINPNGIVFGENAALDIVGSFYATTAEAVPVGSEVFSASQPASGGLLSVSPSALFTNYLGSASGDIQNRGQLAAGENLTLAANRLNLQGQVAAGSNLTLLATDEVQIRDTTAIPFLAFAGGDLRVQGNQVDIVALSHPNSGLYTYGDMVLRSPQPVGGDAHYWSGGDFRVETLDGAVGGLFSPADPIVRSLGDVVIGEYIGTSLHILAGGSITLGGAVITAPEVGALGVDFLRETITLSDGTVVQIDGGVQPTLDIRAGVSPEAIGTPPLELLTGFDPATDYFSDGNETATPSSADMNIGDVFILAADGVILLTNQYQPNLLVAGGDINVASLLPGGGGLFAGSLAGSGNVFIDARNDINVVDSVISTFSVADAGGDITLLAGETVRFSSPSGNFSGAITGAPPMAANGGGDVRVVAQNFDMRDGAQLNATTSGAQNAGNVIVNVSDSVTLDGMSLVSGTITSIRSSVNADGRGNGGNVWVSAGNLTATNGAVIEASTSGVGPAGNVQLEIRETARFDGVNPVIGRGSGVISNVEAGGQGRGGSVEIIANHLEVTNGAQIAAGTFGIGDAGNVILRIREMARFDGVNPQGGASSSGAFTTIEPTGVGQGGNLDIAAGRLAVTNGAQLLASTVGVGNGGNVVLKIRDTAHFDGVNPFDGVSPSGAGSTSWITAIGDGGNVRLEAGSLEVTNGAALSAASLGIGNAGNLNLNVAGQIRLNNGTLATTALFAAGGRIDIQAGNLILRNDSDIQTVVGSGEGSGGNISVKADFTIALDDSDILAFSADGRGGEIDLSRTTFFGQNPTLAAGRLSREELFALDGNGQVDINATGGIASGQITINDASSIENSLNELSGDLVSTETLSAGSCIARNTGSEGSFVVTGSGGLPSQPGGDTIAAYPTGTVQTLPEPAATHIQEPEGVFQLADGRVVLSQRCG